MGCHMQRKENIIYFSNISSSIGMGRDFWFCLGRVTARSVDFFFWSQALKLWSSRVLTWPIPILKYWHWVWVVQLYTTLVPLIVVYTCLLFFGKNFLNYTFIRGYMFITWDRIFYLYMFIRDYIMINMYSRYI